ncbi:hypothetical protein [Agrococcus terreus]|uniref:Uncharacterized protein n=1 Tax=Agrococcus terreus TaxID=574649 RepID=A0ABQ2KGZ5_9MICO|nr:hypothetical protein [Agrococcus terreus]GGN80769.1 hypothetical protein GCM10010968_08930 [Agrococcus terreus]
MHLDEELWPPVVAAAITASVAATSVGLAIARRARGAEPEPVRPDEDLAL